LASAASAHIRIDAPTSRNPIPAMEDGSFLKDGPCGGGATGSRTSDPARITTFAPGETITVQWHETVNHDSHYRISLDMDGQDDFEDPVDENDIVDPPMLPVLLDGIPDPSNERDTFSVEVTLPNETCDTCTLQLTQYMYGRAQPMYYQCADIVIAEGGGGDPVDPVDPGPDVPVDTATGGGSALSGDGDSGDGEGTDVDGDEAKPDDSASEGEEGGGAGTGDESGCTHMQGASGSGHAAWWALGLAMLAWSLRRRFSRV